MNLKIVTDKIQSENHDDKNDAGDHDIPCIRCNIATGIGHYVSKGYLWRIYTESHVAEQALVDDHSGDIKRYERKHGRDQILADILRGYPP